MLVRDGIFFCVYLPRVTLLYDVEGVFSVYKRGISSYIRILILNCEMCVVCSGHSDP